MGELTAFPQVAFKGRTSKERGYRQGGEGERKGKAGGGKLRDKRKGREETPVCIV